MNRGFIYVFTLILLFHMGASGARAQSVYDSLLLNSNVYREKLHLFTDRSVYAAGETMRFRLHNQSHHLLKENSWSKVVYLELISSYLTSVAQGKYTLKPDGASGQLTIPDTLATGVYHLIAYTKWMRNFSSSEYFHLPLVVISPQKIPASELTTGTIPLEEKKREAFSSEGIICTTDLPVYGKREKVKLQLTLDSTMATCDGLSVSVVKKGYLDAGTPGNSQKGGGDQIEPGKILYYPETKGMSISGTVFQGTQEQPVPFANIHMTLLGPNPDYFAIVADDRGGIHFSIPNSTGSRDVLITGDGNSESGYKLSLDEEYSQDYSGISAISLEPGNVSGDIVDEVVRYSQLRKAFLPENKDSISVTAGDTVPAFYGTPEFSYAIDDFIEIPSVEEFILELIPYVQVKSYQKKKYISILDEAGPISEYPPLILVDFVPGLDTETILAVSTRQIASIDVINKVYIRGNSAYGGIISIKSREGNLVGINLPGGSSLLNYSTLNNAKQTEFPDYGSKEYNKRVPDLRTTLYWNAQKEILAGQEEGIEFYTSDIYGTYVAIVRGMTPKGEIVKGVCEFRVE